MLHDWAIATIRTAVPAFVGAVIAWLASRNITVPTEYVTIVAGALVSVATGLYYAGATFLERKVNPNFGLLLGARKIPSYLTPGTTVTLPADVDPVQAGVVAALGEADVQNPVDPAGLVEVVSPGPSPEEIAEAENVDEAALPEIDEGAADVDLTDERG